MGETTYYLWKRYWNNGIDFSGGKDAGGKNLGWESP
jgi:hypothetical protein